MFRDFVIVFIVSYLTRVEDTFRHLTNEESDVTSIDNNDELSYIYYLFTAMGLSEGSSEAVLRTASLDVLDD